MKSEFCQYKDIDGINIPIYNDKAFKKLKESGLLAYELLQYIKPFVVEGITTNELDKLIHNYIIEHGAIPATLGYQGYPKSCCISVNNEICHGIPGKRKLKNGDIVNIDVTVILDGWYGDTSKMFKIGKVNPLASILVDTTLLCLNESIKIVKEGAHLGDIGAKICEIAHAKKFSVVEDFCGHGIGHKFHQEPNVLHFGKKGHGIKLEEGMVFTIEPMINAGKKEIKNLSNGWTAVTKDFSLSAQFEHTIGVTKDGYIIFTLPKDTL